MGTRRYGRTSTPGGRLASLAGLLGLLTALALLAGACSGDSAGDEAGDTADPADRSTTIDIDDGSGADGSSADDAADAGEAPLSAGDQQPTGAGDDFPVAIPQGWTEDLLDFDGSELLGGVNLLYPNDDFGRLVTFYEEWTAERPDEYVQTTGGDVVIFTRVGGEGLINITISRNEQQSADGRPAANLLISAP